MKYLLDTNVLSEIRRRSMNAGVKAWLDRTPESDRATSVLVFAEIHRGIVGKRRDDPAQAQALARWFARLREDFEGRVLPIDQAVADEWATIKVAEQLPVVDALIGATAKVHGLVLVTRNVRDFRRAKVSVLNPFADE